MELIPDDPAFATTLREQSVTVREAERVFTNFEFEVPDVFFSEFEAKITELNSRDAVRLISFAV